MDCSYASKYLGFQFSSTDIADRLASVTPTAKGCYTEHKYYRVILSCGPYRWNGLLVLVSHVYILDLYLHIIDNPGDERIEERGACCGLICLDNISTLGESRLELRTYLSLGPFA